MTQTLHGSCVAVTEGGLLILGPSGSGKSTLALELMALGADLVADDRTSLRTHAGRLLASPPAALAGLIEARDIGLLRAPHRSEAEVTLVIDLGQSETDRLPARHHIEVQGVTLPLVRKPRHPHVSAAILCYLKGSRFS